jgi:tetratricopeptide (TPR) repeat protein
MVYLFSMFFPCFFHVFFFFDFSIFFFFLIFFIVYRGDLLTALNLYRLALLIDPNLPSALMNAGIVCTSLAQYPRALALFQQCLQMGNVDDLKVVLCMAVTYIESGDLERAHSCFVNVLRQDPHNEEALHGMQQLQIHGVQIVTDARVASLCNVASAAKSHGLFREAAQHVAKAYKLAPRDANLALNLALLHECMGNTALAAETLTRRQAQVSPEAAASIAMEKLVYLYRAKYEFLAGALDSVMSTLAVINQYGMAAETSEDMAPYRTVFIFLFLIFFFSLFLKKKIYFYIRSG